MDLIYLDLKTFDLYVSRLLNLLTTGVILSFRQNIAIYNY